jgi:hypothetical protein
MADRVFLECPNCGHSAGEYEFNSQVMKCPECGSLCCPRCIGNTDWTVAKNVCPSCKVLFVGGYNVIGSLKNRY